MGVLSRSGNHKRTTKRPRADHKRTTKEPQKDTINKVNKENKGNKENKETHPHTPASGGACESEDTEPDNVLSITKGAEDKPIAKKRGKRHTDTPPKTSYAEFVSMTNDEYSSLVAKIGEQGAVRCIEILDNYKGANGKKYASDYRAILNWVIKRYEEEQPRPQAAQGRQAFNGGRKETQNEINNRLLDEFFGSDEQSERARLETSIEYNIDEL